MNDTIYRRDAIQAVWIPISERLPEEMGRYLVSYIWVDHVSVEVMAYIKGNFYLPRYEYADEICDTVIAWMELPKPYKGANK